MRRFVNGVEVPLERISIGPLPAGFNETEPGFFCVKCEKKFVVFAPDEQRGREMALEVINEHRSECRYG